ncbi:MAG TPA: RidA family protein [bacterium]|nr:RidA family protein [bacterium]
MPREILRSDQVWDPARVHHPGHDYAQPFSQAVRASGKDMVFVSGQVALDANGNVVGAGDMKAQAHQALLNLKAILAAGGATLADVVKLTVYVTDMSRFAEVQAVRGEFWAGMPLPASTALEVKQLIRKEFLVEIEAIAVK